MKIGIILTQNALIIYKLKPEFQASSTLSFDFKGIRKGQSFKEHIKFHALFSLRVKVAMIPKVISRKYLVITDSEIES